MRWRSTGWQNTGWRMAGWVIFGLLPVALHLAVLVADAAARWSR